MLRARAIIFVSFIFPNDNIANRCRTGCKFPAQMLSGSARHSPCSNMINICTKTDNFYRKCTEYCSVFVVRCMRNAYCKHKIFEDNKTHVEWRSFQNMRLRFVRIFYDETLCYT